MNKSTQPNQQLLIRLKRMLVSPKIGLSFLLLCSFNLQSPVYAQKKIDINKSNNSGAEIFSYIKNVAGYQFIYDSDAIKKLNNISINLKNASIDEVMKHCLNGSSFTYIIEQNTVIIRAKTPTTNKLSIQVSRIISGRVSDDKNQPLVGVTVQLKDSKIATQTNQDGHYQLSIPAELSNGSLVYSILGKKSKEVTIENKANINITLEEHVQALDEFVVTGIFNKSKATYTGVAKEITAEELKQFQGRNIFVTLGNIDPAFNVVQNNSFGSDPNKIPEIQLRGTSSIPNINQLQDATAANLNTPLIVIDNFETTMQRMLDLDVNEVESITLLKDGSATALYGSRGANGVVVIKTKAPVGGKLKLYYRVQTNYSLPDISSYNLLNSADKLELERLSGFYQNVTKDPQQNITLQKYYNEVLGVVKSGVNTNWLAKPLRNGIDQMHNLRVEGGDQSFRYSLGGQYNDQQGVMIGSGRRTFNGTVNLNYNFKNLNFRNNLIIGNLRSTESPYGSFGDYTKLNPYWSPYDADGKLVRFFTPYNYTYWSQKNSGSTDPYGNPLYDATLNTYNIGRNTSIINNFQIDWTPFSGLVLRSGFGITSEHESRDDFKPADHSMFNNYDDRDIFRKGKYAYDSGNKFSYTGNFTANYFLRIANQHQITTGFNVDISQNKSTSYGFRAEGFPDESIDFLGMALQYEQGGKPAGSESTTRRIGLVFNTNYSFKDRYIADFSYRLDGASQFGVNRRFAPFWSTGAAWIMHREGFIKDNLPFVNHMKLRASYGMTGSTQFSAYQSQSIYQYYLNDRYNNWMGAYQTSLGNPDLEWQKTDQYNLGLELKLFHDRLSITGDVYTKNTSNLLSSLDLPYSNGFTEYNENIGRLEEKGFELSSSYWIIPFSGKNFSWSVTANIAHNSDKIAQLSEALKAANEKLRLTAGTSPNKIIKEGASQNTIYVVRSLGIDPSNGKEIFLDRNGDVTYLWNAADRVDAGISVPKYRGNFSTAIRYKTITLNASVGFRLGGQLYNSTVAEKVENPDKFFNVDQRVFTDRWIKPGDHARYKGLNDFTLGNATSRFVQNESSLFMQNISINYDMINKAWLNRYGVKTLSIGMNSGELFYLSSIQQERGTAYPFTRQVSFNLSVLF